MGITNSQGSASLKSVQSCQYFILGIHNMCGSRKIFQRGSKFDYVFFLVDEGRDDPKTTINGPSCWLGSFVVLQGIQASIARKSYIFVIFQGEGPDLLFPISGSVHVQTIEVDEGPDSTSKDTTQ